MPSKTALTKSADPIQRSSLIRVFSVWYSDKHFINSLVPISLVKNRKRKVLKSLEHLPYGPRRENIGLLGFQQSESQTSLLTQLQRLPRKLTFCL